MKSGKIKYRCKRKMIEKTKEWQKNHREQCSRRVREWRANNPEQHTNNHNKHYAKNREQILKQNSKWRKNNRDKVNARWRQRMKDDPEFKLSVVLRVRLNEALKNNQKTGSAVRDLGCSIAELKTYLESKFHPHPVTGENMS